MKICSTIKVFVIILVSFSSLSSCKKEDVKTTYYSYKGTTEKIEFVPLNSSALDTTYQTFPETIISMKTDNTSTIEIMFSNGPVLEYHGKYQIGLPSLISYKSIGSKQIQVRVMFFPNDQVDISHMTEDRATGIITNYNFFGKKI